MTLEELRAQARAVATRMETRLNAAISESRDMTADEEAANTADEDELAGLKADIATAEATETPPAPPSPADAAVTAERARISALVDLCPSSVLSTSLKQAITNGQQPGAFAIDLAKAAKARGASVADLRAGAVQPDQLPGAKRPGDDKPKTGAERGAGIVARAAALGHSAVAHLAPKG